MKHFWTEILVLSCLVLLALPLRLFKLTDPLADWHSFRQADTASITREFVRQGIDLLHPQYQDLSNIQSGKDNPQGWRMVEFPMVNGLTAFILKSWGLQSQEVMVGRLVSVFFSLVTLSCIYVLGRNTMGRVSGFAAALAYAVLPYAGFYSRAILPETPMLAGLCLSLVGWYYFARKGSLGGLVVAWLGLCFAILLKPFVLSYGLVYLAVAWQVGGWTFFRRKWWSLVLLATSVGPFFLWRQWITQFPEGIPSSDWLWNNENIRGSGAFFHWIYEVRVSELILGIGLVPLLLIGLLGRGKSQLQALALGSAVLAYTWIVAGGNVRHDYYQVLTLPALCWLVGRGAGIWWQLPSLVLSRVAKIVGLVGMYGFAIFVSWYTVRGYYNINHWEIVHAGQAADRLLPADAKVIAPYMGDTAFLYQTKRRGWPIGFQIPDKISRGAQYYISVNYDDETNELMRKYPVLAKTPEYVILRLQQL